VKQLAADTGANLVLDPRLKDRASAPVTLKLEDVPLETTVRLLAEVADLRAVRMSNVLFVTTPERAEKLRPDADGPVPATGATPFFNDHHPRPAPFGVFGGIVPVAPPLQAVPAPAPKVEAPAEGAKVAPPPPPAGAVDRNGSGDMSSTRVTRASARPSLGLRQTAPIAAGVSDGQLTRAPICRPFCPCQNPS